MKIKLIAFNGRYIHSCLALFYVREELIKHIPGAEIEPLQLTINDPYYKTLLTISDGNPEALFFSSYIWSSELISRVVSDLQQVLPEAAFVLGGPQAPVIAENIKSERITILTGEVEGAPAAFYNELKSGSLQKEYQCAPGQPFPSPYTDDDLAEELKNRHIYYESTRGCPFSCSYCLSSVGREVTRKDIDQVKNELTHILKHKPRIIKFVDRTFNEKPARALEIWRFLADLDTNTKFHFEMAPDRFTDDMFDFLSDIQPGFFQFELGIQSTNPETLSAINRVMDLETASDNIRRLSEPDNIHLHVDLILGLPLETRESYLQALRSVFAMKPHYIQMGLLKALPETSISNTTGLIYCSKPPYQVLCNSEMDHETISYLYRLGECVEAFHNTRYFPLLFKYIRDRKVDICDFFEGLCNVCIQRDFFNLSHTQEMLTTILVDYTAEREDWGLLKELLLFDWLRCGHRFLPECLDTQNLVALRKELGSKMKQSSPPLYDHQTRNEFFKKSVFARFSGEALNCAGFNNIEADGHVAFFPEREESIYSFQKTHLL